MWKKTVDVGAVWGLSRAGGGREKDSSFPHRRPVLPAAFQKANHAYLDTGISGWAQVPFTEKAGSCI